MLFRSDIENFTDEDFVKFKTASNKLHKELTKAMDEMRKAEEEYNLLIENYDKKLALNTLEIIFKRYFGDCKDEKILSYLFDMKEDIIKNLDKFKQVNSKNKVIFTAMKVNKAFFDRYKVNLFIDNSQKDTLPVIEETNPTYYNLNGYLEYKNRQGSFITSFLDIKAGALQKANGRFFS